MKTMPIAVPSEKDLEPEEDVEEGDPEADEPEDLEGADEPEDLLESWEADNEHTLYELYGGKEGDSIYVTDQEVDEDRSVLLASDLKELDEAILILSEMRDQVRHRAMLRRKGRLK
jgi:hypothetical protein